MSSRTTAAGLGCIDCVRSMKAARGLNAAGGVLREEAPDRPSWPNNQTRRAATTAKAGGVRGEGVPPAANRPATTATIICACVMQGVDTTIANVCLPHIQGSMSASQDQISWVLTSYIVASAIMMPLTGWLAGRFGVKYIFLASVIGFTVASALCGAATSLSQLVFYRLLQGVCGAGLVPLGQATLFTILSARAPRLCDGDLQHRRDDGADHRPDPRWLADRKLRLALVLLRQPAGRHTMRARHLRFHPPIPPDAARPIRRLRVCHAEPRRRRAAIDARPRPDQGLVPLDRDLDRGDDRGVVFLSVGRPYDDDRRTLVPEPRIIEEPEFCRRQFADVRGRDDPQRHFGADAVDDAGADELPGVRRRVDDGAARVRHDVGNVSCGPNDQPGRQSPVHP